MNNFNQITEQAYIATDTIGKSLTAPYDNEPNVPEVLDSYETALNKPGVVLRLFTTYLYQIQKLIQLKEDDLLIITKALEIKEQLQPKEAESASHATIVDFYRATSPEQREKIEGFIQKMSDPNSELFHEALQVLSTMMHNGHVMKREGRTPRDGDEESDRVIWGHTQLSDPYFLIEFTICHFIERCMTVVFQREGLEIANHKDWFLNILTDVITYNIVRNSRFIEHISYTWRMPRALGGLGWISKKRLAAFRQAYEQKRA